MHHAYGTNNELSNNKYYIIISHGILVDRELRHAVDNDYDMP